MNQNVKHNGQQKINGLAILTVIPSFYSLPWQLLHLVQGKLDKRNYGEEFIAIIGLVYM